MRDPTIRSRPIGFCLASALIMLLATAPSYPVQAHGWYDADCCSGHDCEPVQNVTYVASDPAAPPVMIVTTSLGTKPKTPQTKIRDSKDARMHACIYQGVLLCLYMPPGN
jgi:hypothetical protein